MIRKNNLEAIRTLPAQLSRRVLGQSAALEAIATWGCSWLAGVLEKAPRILLLGPTGVGKTECALALSEAMTGREPARLDMSEFQLQESVGALLGDRTGDAGRLRPLLVGSPRPLLLLDEIEKAHPRVLDLLLQMLEPGHLTTGDGQRIDLTPVPIVCTSNLATAAVADVQSLSAQVVEEHILAQVRKHLRAETLNRFDALVVFQPLDLDAQHAIVRYQLDCYLRWLETRGYRVTATEEVEQFLLLRGFDRSWGARPLRRAMRQHVGKAIVTALLRDHDGSGTLAVDGAELSLQELPA